MIFKTGQFVPIILAIVHILSYCFKERYRLFEGIRSAICSLYIWIFVFVIFAFVGLFLNQFSYLQAIALSNAGTATVLQYLCPVIILVYICLKNRTAPTASEVTSIVLAMAGTFLIATHGQWNQLSVTPLGLF